LGREQSYGPAGPVLAAVAVLLIAGISLRGHPQPQKPVQRIPETEVGSHFAPVAAQPAPQDAQEQRRDKLLARGEPTVYDKWLREDVAYIITDQERTAFKQLGTDEEREHFIEQFWLRRDPTPGTPSNEMKEEHYRRIAYTNEHFATGIPGWKTDRGRVYITYGPPDEIEDHSKDNPPVQLWRYRFIDGIGENIIIEFAGPEYRMTMDPTEKAARAGGEERLEQFAKLQKPPVSATADVFVANEPGGRVTVSVDGGRAVVSLPISAAGSAKVQVLGRVETQSGRPAANFVDKVDVTRSNGITPHYVLTLGTGAYSLTVVYKNLDTGETRQETVNFWVK
jgi:GWxTD domain-containing protein